MHFASVFAALIIGSSALESPHRKGPQKSKRDSLRHAEQPTSHHPKRSSSYLTAKTQKFAVNGSAIPQINFDVGESYAGTLPIDGNSTNENQLWFWFWPSENELAGDEITIWLNGGPGCSSLDGLFQENGPFMWQSGTYSPMPNPYSWTNLTNMIYIDQPVGTGLSPAAEGFPATITNEEQVATQFMGFWKNFMETFGLQGRKVYITGESYAGQYIPYISYYMLEANNTEFYNVKGIQINDPSINEDDALMYAPAVGALNENAVIFGLNETFMKHINERNEACGYADFMEKSLTFPPNGTFPNAPNSSKPDCDTWDQIVTAAAYVNPCFNWYHTIDFCPYVWSELGFPSLAAGPNNYFNQTDVQKALHAPSGTNFAICGDDTLFPGGDQSVPSALGPLPKVIEKTNNVILGHGLLDFLLIANGSLVTIQNMTWNGLQGFQKAPSPVNNFYVPYHAGLLEAIEAIDSLPPIVQPYLAGAGLLGTTHTERGLTFVTVDHAGHEIPQYVPGAAYRQLEFLLGRIPSLTYVSDFTTQRGNYTGHSNSTVL